MQGRIRAAHEVENKEMEAQVRGSTRAAALAAIESFLAEAGMSERAFSLRVANNSRLVSRLRAGAHLTLRSIEEAESFIDAYRAWAAGAKGATR